MVFVRCSSKSAHEIRATAPYTKRQRGHSPDIGGDGDGGGATADAWIPVRCFT